MWLNDRLAEAFPERVIPPLPDKNRLEYLGRFTPDFIKKRQVGLKRFLHRIDRHPILGTCDDFISFLEQPVAGMTKETDKMASFDALPGSTDKNKSSSNTTANEPNKVSAYLAPILEGLGDVLLAAFLRSPQSVNDDFVKLKQNVQTARSHLSQLERLFHHRISALQPTIIAGMQDISSGFEELAGSIDINLSSQVTENDPEAVPLSLVKAMLSRVSATMTQCRTILSKSMDSQETQMHAVLAEMVQYCDAALEVILQRDRRQVEHEELEALLEKYQKERDELRGFSKEETMKAEASKEETIKKEEETTTETESSSTTKPTVNGSIMSFLQSKWDAWKGIDPITAKQNRLARLNEQIIQLQKALQTATKLLDRANTSLREEIGIFEGILRAELGEELQGYTRGQIYYHESNLVYWRDFLSWLENPPKHLA